MPSIALINGQIKNYTGKVPIYKKIKIKYKKTKPIKLKIKTICKN